MHLLCFLLFLNFLGFYTVFAQTQDDFCEDVVNTMPKSVNYTSRRLVFELPECDVRDLEILYQPHFICVSEWCNGTEIASESFTSVDFFRHEAEENIVLNTSEDFLNFTEYQPTIRTEGGRERIYPTIRTSAGPPNSVVDLSVSCKYSYNGIILIKWKSPYPPTGNLESYTIEHGLEHPNIPENQPCDLGNDYHCVHLLILSGPSIVIVRGKNKETKEFGVSSNLTIFYTDDFSGSLNIDWETEGAVLKWQRRIYQDCDTVAVNITVSSRNRRNYYSFILEPNRTNFTVPTIKLQDTVIIVKTTRDGLVKESSLMHLPVGTELVNNYLIETCHHYYSCSVKLPLPRDFTTNRSYYLIFGYDISFNQVQQILEEEADSGYLFNSTLFETLLFNRQGQYLESQEGPYNFVIRHDVYLVVNNSRNYSIYTLFKKNCQEEILEGFTFPETPVGTFAIANTQNPCFDADYLPLRRQCMKNGTWGRIEGTCTHRLSNFPETTKILFNLSSNEDFEGKLEIVKKSVDSLKPFDVYLVSEILQKTVEDHHFHNASLFEIADRLMELDRSSLRDSQVLNSTDRILDVLDKSLIDHKLDLNLPNILTGRVQFRSNSVVGVSVSGHTAKLLYNFTNLLEEDFDIAFKSSSITEEMIYAVFYNDHLFNDKTNSSVSQILDILSPDRNSVEEIDVYFKIPKKSYNPKCAYWKYGFNNNLAIRGSWFHEDESIFVENYYKCRFNHAAHFALLFSQTPNQILGYISVVGSAMSLIGALLIFTTAAVFKQWRNDPAHKIILNIVTCLSLFIILFYVSYLTPPGLSCIVVGALLHATMLSSIFWTSMICYSNYKRFLSDQLFQRQNVLLYFLISWGCPIVIVFCVLAIDYSTYQKELSSPLCYPKNNFFKFAVLLPFCAILLVNLIIYLCIIKKLTTTDYDLRRHKKTKSYAEMKSIFLLFFLMGLTWIFGVLNFFVEVKAFSYLFCVVTAFHGLILFVFYIVDSQVSRRLWGGKFKGCCGTKKTDETESNVLSSLTSQDVGYKK